MTNSVTKGYDGTVIGKENDDLDRWRFASNIMEVLKNVPKEWSVRIGVYGKWGEGKTNVLTFLDEIATSESHVVVWFNPSAIRDQNELWIKFSEKLIKKLNDAEIPVEGFSKLKILGNKLKKGAIVLSTINKYSEAIVGGGLSFLENLLRVDGDTLKNIRKKLVNKQIIILIDDLDRTDPKLLPHLLMTLRELLDLPGFSFLLAFDKEIVATSLKDYHPAWGTGHEFLEKIIDFSFDLPEITEIQQKNLLRKEIGKYCTFVNPTALDEITDLLPNNPRKLKLFVRHLAILKNEVERHDSYELDWISIFIAQLIKMESEEFLRLVLNDTSDNDILNWSFIAFTRDKDKHQHDIDTKITSLLDRCQIKDDEKRDRLRNLIHKWGVRSGIHNIEHFRYQANFTSRPSPITWKEFREIFKLWKDQKKAQEINKWVNEQAKKRNTSHLEVAIELFETTLLYRENQLSRAADTQVEEQHNKEIKEASEALSLLSLLFTQGLESVEREYFSTSKNFERLLNMVGKWILFNKIPEDKEARREEFDFMVQCAKIVSTNPELFVEVIKPWSNQPENAEYKIEYGRLRDKLMEIFEPILSEKAVSLFEEKGGIARLFEKNEKKAFRYVLFNKEGSLWKEPLKSQFYKVITRADREALIHENCIDYFNLLIDGIEEGMHSQEFVSEFINMDGFIEALWKSVTARKIQFRFQNSFREKRKKLIKCGIVENKMPLPDWMSESADKNEERK